ncbi:hypothetical protein DSECCO2_440670 [anaerobic digester metagenome]
MREEGVSPLIRADAVGELWQDQHFRPKAPRREIGDIQAGAGAFPGQQDRRTIVRDRKKLADRHPRRGRARRSKPVPQSLADMAERAAAAPLQKINDRAVVAGVPHAIINPMFRALVVQMLDDHDFIAVRRAHHFAVLGAFPPVADITA